MSDWISLADRKPEYDDRVLIWPCDPEHPSARFDGEYFRVQCCGQVAREVTHWMPYPDGPEGEPSATSKRAADDDWKRRGIA